MGIRVLFGINYPAAGNRGFKTVSTDVLRVVFETPTIVFEILTDRNLIALPTNRAC